MKSPQCTLIRRRLLNGTNNETQTVHGPSVGGRRRPICQWLLFFGEVVIWMEDASCVQPHVH
jgi:hypothetical protein